MNWPNDVRNTIKRLNSVKHVLKGMFTERQQAIDLLLLSTICQEHLLLIGPPGTAKTAIIDRYTELIDAKGFRYLLTRFTEPSELFGPLDLQAFQQGAYSIRTESMLPQAQLVFLDEIFQGSSAILNSLLTLLNERLFFNGAERQRVPLMCLIGASNIMPEDPSLEAFADRFVLRLEVDKVSDERIHDLLEQGWTLEKERIEAVGRAIAGQAVGRVLPNVKIQDILSLHQRLNEVDVSKIRSDYGNLIRELRAEGVEFSDRRIIKGLKLVAGAALLRESDIATSADLWPVIHIWNRLEEASVIKSVVQNRMAQDGEQLVDTKRSVMDISLDLETLEEQERYLISESALGAHLIELNKLRRELITNHPEESDLRKHVEAAIERGLKRMEGSYV